MKKLFGLALVFVLMFQAVPAGAQEAIFIAPDAEDLEYVEEPIEARPVGFTGIVAQILKAFQPLQLINPFAPRHYGTGEQNVSSGKDFSASYYDAPDLTVAGVEW